MASSADAGMRQMAGHGVEADGSDVPWQAVRPGPCRRRIASKAFDPRPGVTHTLPFTYQCEQAGSRSRHAGQAVRFARSPPRLVRVRGCSTGSGGRIRAVSRPKGGFSGSMRSSPVDALQSQRSSLKRARTCMSHASINRRVAAPGVVSPK